MVLTTHEVHGVSSTEHQKQNSHFVIFKTNFSRGGSRSGGGAGRGRLKTDPQTKVCAAKKMAN